MTSFEKACTTQNFEAAQESVRPRAAGHSGVSRATGSLSAKRIFDIFGALTALIFFTPIMASIYLVLKISCGKPLFFHRRIGKNGVPFHCYKFRSMVRNADQVLADHLNLNPDAREEWDKTYKLTHDPRITWCGGFLRHTSLDELPQLFNVLQGTMSLVGPRPIVEAEIKLYAEHIDAYYSCRPGITGLWQVSGRNLVSYEKRVELDALYASKQSLRFDLAILMRTVMVVINRRGAL